MKFRTEIEVGKLPFNIGYNTPTLFIGSCFTENIGAIMRENKMPVITNPFGVVYNPFSIHNSIQNLIDNKNYTDSDIHFKNGLWYSYDHHTRYSAENKDDCLQRINQTVNEGHKFLNKLQNLVVTFGTARLYRLKSNGKVVANCHKVPAKEFEHQLMEVDEIVEIWSNLLSKLISKNQSVKIIFTVSPIRHWKDGAEGNQLSKSTLIVATHKLIKLFPNNAFYFPSYEIVMDDLRDYRFYDDDMLHPSSKAIDYIWGKFENAFLDKESKEMLAKIHKIKQAVGHRPFNPSTGEHQKFINQTIESINEIKSQHPLINFDDEIEKLNSQIC